ncbi:carbonic anhydrase 5A, mitochondrial [Gastrophryne carolinensis]
MLLQRCRTFLSPVLVPTWTRSGPRVTPRHNVPARLCNISACSYRLRNVDLHPLWKGPLDIPGGARQSPIDIRVRDSIFHPQLSPIKTQYDPNTCMHVWNNGYSFLVEYDDCTNKSVVSGGPLENPYRLKQFHFHWGANNDWGSEHTVDSKVFPAELHLVHWNCSRYRTFEEAVMEENGLAVVGVFLKVGRHHEKLQKLVDILPSVRYKSESSPRPVGKLASPSRKARLAQSESSPRPVGKLASPSRKACLAQSESLPRPVEKLASPRPPLAQSESFLLDDYVTMPYGKLL